MKKFKRTLALILVCVIVFTTFVFVNANAAGYGDMNDDGNINIKDVLVIRNYLANKSATAIDANVADAYKDNTVDVKDVLAIRKYIAGVVTSLPIGSSGLIDPNMPDGVDGAYKNELCDEVVYSNVKYSVTINQCGYTTDEVKICKLVEADNEYTPTVSNSLISKKICYLVNVDTDTAVASFTSEKRSIYSRASVNVSSVDFSSYTTPGTYRIYAPAGYSYPFEIKANAYQTVTNAMVDALYYNRCGCALDESIVAAGHARPACHIVSTGSNAGKEVTICDTYNETTGKFNQNTNPDGTVKTYAAADFSGGLHDAGDYGRYTSPACQVVADLLYSYEMNPTVYTTDKITDRVGENLPDILDEARYEAEWILKMQAPSGGFYYKICTDKFASATWSRPENDKDFIENGFKIQHVNMESTSNSAAVLASCYYTFKTIDPEFANNCLTASKKGYAYYVANINSTSPEMIARRQQANGLDSPGVGGGSYSGTAYDAGAWYMACALYRATGDSVYHDYIKACAAKNTANTPYAYYTGMTAYGTGGYGTLCYLLMKKFDKEIAVDSTIASACLNAFVTGADSAAKNTNNDRFNSVLGDGKYVWGSNQAMNNILKRCTVATYFTATDYSDTIRLNINFFLGVNPRNYCLVTAAGPKASKNIHHFPSAIIQNEKKGDCVPGLIVGGFCEEGQSYYYADNKDDFRTNEICVYWNSSPIMTFGTVVAKDLDK